MRVALTAVEPQPDAAIDPRLGRAKFVMIYDTDTEAWLALDNQEIASAPGGAGIAVAELMASHQVNVVLTGACGPKAAKAFQAAKIPVHEGVAGTVSQALQAFLNGEIA